jgi:hypothetical protein
MASISMSISTFMLEKKAKKESGEALLLAIKREMAKPREVKSVREKGENLAAARIRRSKRGKTKL